jgi:hypothetical protein
MTDSAQVLVTTASDARIVRCDFDTDLGWF